MMNLHLPACIAMGAFQGAVISVLNGSKRDHWRLWGYSRRPATSSWHLGYRFSDGQHGSWIMQMITKIRTIGFLVNEIVHELRIQTPPRRVDVVLKFPA